MAMFGLFTHLVGGLLILFGWDTSGHVLVTLALLILLIEELTKKHETRMSEAIGGPHAPMQSSMHGNLETLPASGNTLAKNAGGPDASPDVPVLGRIPSPKSQ